MEDHRAENGSEARLSFDIKNHAGYMQLKANSKIYHLNSAQLYLLEWISWFFDECLHLDQVRIPEKTFSSQTDLLKKKDR